MQILRNLGEALHSTAVVLFGRHGEVTEQARQQGRSRQALYRDCQQVLGTLEGKEAQARIEQLERELAQQSAEVESLRARLACTVEISEDKQAEFASTGQAEGVSLPVLRRLLAVFLGEKTPSVPTLNRHTLAAAQQSQKVLEVLDAASRTKVREAAADEIFLASRRY